MPNINEPTEAAFATWVKLDGNGWKSLVSIATEALMTDPDELTESLSAEHSYRNAVIEECAKVADSMRRRLETDYRGNDTIAMGIAYGIRDLKSQEHDGWQSIETAPKDGTPVLLAGGEDENYGYGRNASEDNAMRSPCRAWWNGKDWVITLTEAGCVTVCRDNPTHWRPLPPPAPLKSQEPI